MKKFRFLSFIFYLLISLFSVGCDSSQPKTTQELKEAQHICPQCNMPMPKSNINTSYIDTTYFDDVGCLVLWAKENSIDLKKQTKMQVFTSDTKKYLNPFECYFTFDGRTPMLYGFVPYEKACKNCIKFDEVIVRMLRGEHMANPKIRKQILGY